MEAGTTSTTLTAKLPILKPGDYDLYAERTIGETEQEYEPTTAKKKPDRKEEMKLENLLMGTPNKDQLKFHSYKDAKLLMEAIEKRKFYQYPDSEVDSCSKSCVKAYATLKEQYDSLSSNYKKSQFNLVSYKACLESVEARLAHYKKNEIVFEESINVLNLEVKLRDKALVENKKKLEKAEKERDELKLTLEKFQNSSKSLNNLMESQNIRRIISPNLIRDIIQFPPPYIGKFIPSKPDLMFMDETVESENMDDTTIVTPSNVKTVESNHDSTDVKSNSDAVEPKTVKKNSFRPPVIKDWNSDDDSEVQFIPNVEDKIVRPSTEKIKFVKSVRETVKNYEMIVRRFVPQAVLTRSGKINTAGASVNTVRVKDTTARDRAVGNPQQKEYKEKGFIDSDGKGRISRKGKIKTRTLDFDNVYFCKELKYDLFSVSQICDKKNNVLFTDTECLIFLFSDFKLLDESQVLLRVPRKDNIYSVDLKSVVPTRGLTCLFAKATIDESNLWHRRLGHTNFKNMNKLIRGNLVRGLPLMFFENDHSCVACQKGKQHKASYKTKLVNSISKPLHMLHMDLFGPTNVKSLMKKSYCLVVTDDFSRFSWVFFLATKDETSGILKTFIIEIENQLDHKVKVIRCDNGTEFKNSVMN
ncbi:putative ribonuclease H-like domain-containing protein [Tanacetum coccineum]